MESKTPVRRLRGAIGGIAIVAATAPGYIACGTDTPYAEICTDTRTGVRVDDQKCHDAPEVYSGGPHAPFMWRYYDSRDAGATVPHVGSRAVGGNYLTPRGKPTISKALPAGGKVSSSIIRGGFGLGASGKSSGS